MSFCCTVGYKWVAVMGGVTFELDDIILSLHTKNDSEQTHGSSAKDIIYIIITINMVASVSWINIICLYGAKMSWNQFFWNI